MGSIRYFDWPKIKKSCDVSLVTFFGDVITDFLKVRFCHNQLGKPQFQQIK